MKKQIAALATDESHILMWDMDSLLADCIEFPCLQVDTRILIPQNWMTIDTAYAMTTDVTRPILLFELPQDRLFLADGNHRLYRAAAEGIPSMSAILIPQEIHLRHLYRCTEDTYQYVIAGLADEGIFIPNFTISCE